uniref:Uncharacterized protein n=1 Tax=Timspurckia oligopyrenoides TaxID=708627 RepID=A0A7S1ETJ1_9RHOD|mmetsp:Transcript_6228/g.11103  ORF Transcript_6228/g.11103 Transcript_6228/m.11103 type:complete len:158 (+) Transcript_6228:143-616(+)
MVTVHFVVQVELLQVVSHISVDLTDQLFVPLVIQKPWYLLVLKICMYSTNSSSCDSSGLCIGVGSEQRPNWCSISTSIASESEFEPAGTVYGIWFTTGADLLPSQILFEDGNARSGSAVQLVSGSLNLYVGDGLVDTVGGVLPNTLLYDSVCSTSIC